MENKIKVLALLSIIIAAAVGASLVFAFQPTVKANSTTNNIASDVSQQVMSSVNFTSDNASGPFTMGQMRFGGPGGFGGRGMCRGFGPEGFGAIQISSDFTANVTNIANNDSDVQNLLSQGYNITSVGPIITTTIDGNGTLTTKATTAELTLQSTNGRAQVIVDLSQAKVTKIVTITRTEIDK
jgi:hypothetical protein